METPSDYSLRVSVDYSLLPAHTIHTFPSLPHQPNTASHVTERRAGTIVHRQDGMPTLPRLGHELTRSSEIHTIQTIPPL